MPFFFLSSYFSPVSPPTSHFVHLPLVFFSFSFHPPHPFSFLLSVFLALSSLLSHLCHPEFLFICTSSSLPLLLSHQPLIPPIFSRLFLLLHIHLSALFHPPLCHLFSTIPPSIPPTPPIVPHLRGRLVPPRLPTTSAALPCQTVPTSPEGWASAARSTLASSEEPGTSKAPPTLAGLRPHHCHTATARPGGHTVPQGFSASSHPSLYAGEWQKRGRSMRKWEG